MRLWCTLVLAACVSGKPDGDDPEATPTPQDSQLDTVEPDTDIDTDTVDTVDTDPSDTDPPQTPLFTVEASGVTVCADPTLREEQVFDTLHSAAIIEPEPLRYQWEGGGMAVADFDDDGRLDVFIGGVSTSHLRMQVSDLVFNEESDTRLAGIDLSRAASATAVDYDGDGDLDLFVTRYLEPNSLLANDGTGVFTDVTESSGITGVHRSQSGAWGDMDGDGDLDLAIGNYGPKPVDTFGDSDLTDPADPSQIWENQGDGTFVDRSDLIPQAIHDGHTFMTAWWDVDLDGDQDLLFINDFGWTRPGGLFWNTNTGLQLDSGAAGFDIPFAGMGLGIGDINGDGLPDFLQSSWQDTSLLMSRGGWWAEEAAARQLVPVWERAPRQTFGWGAELADFDNDGDLDAIMNYGLWDEYNPNQRLQGDAVFLQDAAGNFSDQADALGLQDSAPNRGLAVVDINNDGAVDLVKRRLHQSTTMQLSRCNDNNWLRVRLRMPGPNTRAIGARIEVVTPDESWVRWIHAGSTSMYTGTAPEAHFGLGGTGLIQKVEVHWPDGIVTEHPNVPARQILDITRTR